MMFNLREAAEHGVNIGTSAWTVDISDQPTLTDMDFTEWRAPPVTPTTEQTESSDDEQEKGKMREVPLLPSPV